MPTEQRMLSEFPPQPCFHLMIQKRPWQRQWKQGEYQLILSKTRTHKFCNQISLVYTFNGEGVGDIFLRKKFSSNLGSLELALPLLLVILLTRSSTDQETNCFSSFSFLQWQNSIIKNRATFLLSASAYPSGLILVL